MREGTTALRAGRHAEAEQAYRAALAEASRSETEDLRVARSAGALGKVAHEQGRYADAIELYQRQRAIFEATLGPDHVEVGLVLNNLGLAYQRRGRYDEAEPLLRRSLVIEEKALGPDHPHVLVAVNNLAVLNAERGRYAEAALLLQRVIATSEQTHGAEHLDVALGLLSLAGVEKEQGRYADAETIYRRALAIRAPALGPEHAEVAAVVSALATLYHDEGRYREAEQLYRRALAAREKSPGPEPPDHALTLNNLGMLYRDEGRYAEAQVLLQRALAVWERTLGPEHPDVATALNNLGLLFRYEGRAADSAALYRRSLTIREKVLGPDNPAVAQSLSNLAVYHRDRGEYALAEPLQRRAVAILEAALGSGHPRFALGLNNLAELERESGGLGEAELLHRRALAIREAALGPQHPDVAQSLHNLGKLMRAQGRYAEADPLYRRSLGIRETALGSAHPDVITSLTSLAYLKSVDGHAAEARTLYERSRHVMLAVARSSSELEDDARRGLFKEGRAALADYTALLADLARGPSNAPAARSAMLDAFVTAEQARSSAAEAALVKASARAAAADPDAATIARRVEDLRFRRQAAQRLVTSELGKPTARRDDARLAALQASARQIDRDAADAARQLSAAFPKYDEVAGPEPIDAAGAQALLRSDEGLLSFFCLDNRVLIWFLRPDRPPVYRDVAVKRSELTATVSRVRASMDQHLNANLSAGLAPFDVAGARELYRVLLESLEPELEGVRHVILVPDELLLPLPFAALVTGRESEVVTRLAALHDRGAPLEPRDLTAYKSLPWLARRYAITTLPTVTSLRALRRNAPPRRPVTERLLAFGDPVLDGRGSRRGGAVRAAADVRDVVASLRTMDRLPGTREELLAVASALGADPERALYLGARATKPEVLALNRSGRLGHARVLAFATHGLLAGDVAGLGQPALVLTPPAAPSEQDDGLLRLDDVLSLVLTETEWTILSACQTASDDGSGEGLSGLTRAFLFAGTRSVLASHWSVEDRATQGLMTAVFQRWAADATLSRAEALRRGMLELMDGAAGPTAYFAHPFAWAPFFLIGEGG